MSFKPRMRFGHKTRNQRYRLLLNASSGVEDLIANADPELDWRFAVDTGNVPNAGSAGSSYDIIAIGTPRYEVEGGSAEGSLAVGLDGDTTDEGFYMDETTSFAALEAMTAGSIFLAFRYTGAGADDAVLFRGENGSGADVFQLALLSNTGTGELQFTTVEGANQRALITSSAGYDDGEWHTVTIVQPGDGTGPVMYVDGALDQASRTISTAGSAEDTWFPALADTWAYFTIGYRGFGGGGNGSGGGIDETQGDLDYLFITSTVLDSDSVAELNSGYTG